MCESLTNQLTHLRNNEFESVEFVFGKKEKLKALYNDEKLDHTVFESPRPRPVF